jgi:hypothetical protein
LANPNIVANGHFLYIVIRWRGPIVLGLIDNPAGSAHRVSAGIHNRTSPGNSTIPANRNTFANHKRAPMGDDASAANLQHWPVHETVGKSKSALSVDKNVIADNDVSLAHDPVNEDAGSEIPPITFAISFEKRLGNEDSPEKEHHNTQSEIDP